MRSEARNGRSMGLGIRRPMAGFRGRWGGKWLGRRGWGANRGRRGRGGRRGGRRPPPPSREQLDQEIEVIFQLRSLATFLYICTKVYMSGTKSVLDKQLDDYRYFLPLLKRKNSSVVFRNFFSKIICSGWRGLLRAEAFSTLCNFR